MSNLATTIQTWAQIYSDDSNLTITSGDGLEVLNEVYAGMFNPDYKVSVGGRFFTIGRNWAETWESNDLGVNTTSGTNDYAWLTSPIYREEPQVLLETSAGGGDYEVIPPGDDEILWNRLVNASNGRPQRYRRYRSGSTMTLRFAPTPDTSSLDIILRGHVEITKFTSTTAVDGSTNTIFFNDAPDQALAYFIAANFKAKRGDPRRAIDLILSGLGLLPSTDYMPSRDENEIVAHYL